MWSFIAVALFDNKYGVLHGGDGEVFGTQLLGLASILVWSAFFGIFIFAPFSLREMLKINENIQVIGLMHAKISIRGFVLSEESNTKDYNQVAFDEFSEEVDDSDS